MSLTPKNWDEFQHYKDRKPAWIKLHRALLDDYAFACLPLASQALAPRIWLLASEYKDGKITSSMEEIAYRLHTTVEALVEALKPLVDAGFFIDDSNSLAPCKQDAIPEKERETEKEQENSSLREASNVSRVTTDEADLFRRGKEVLGTNTGGLIAKLLKSKKGSVPLARAAIEQAATKHDPREYIGAAIRGPVHERHGLNDPMAGII